MILVIVMTGAVAALIISLMMIFLVIYKAHCVEEEIYYTKKAEAFSLLDGFPDDCIIQIRIGRNIYGYKGTGISRRRNLRNNISE